MPDDNPNAAQERRPASPCTRVCTLDDDDVCMGCGRTLAEIVGWAAMSAAEQRAVLARLPERRWPLRR